MQSLLDEVSNKFQGLFHNNSPVTLHCSPATTILSENPDPTYTVDSDSQVPNSKVNVTCRQVVFSDKIVENK